MKEIELTPERIYKLGFKACTCGGWDIKDKETNKQLYHIDKYFISKEREQLYTVEQLKELYFKRNGHELTEIQ